MDEQSERVDAVEMTHEPVRARLVLRRREASIIVTGPTPEGQVAEVELRDAVSALRVEADAKNRAPVLVLTLMPEVLEIDAEGRTRVHTDTLNALCALGWRAPLIRPDREDEDAAEDGVTPGPGEVLDDAGRRWRWDAQREAWTIGPAPGQAAEFLNTAELAALCGPLWTAGGERLVEASGALYVDRWARATGVQGPAVTEPLAEQLAEGTPVRFRDRLERTWVWVPGFKGWALDLGEDQTSPLLQWPILVREYGPMTRVDTGEVGGLPPKWTAPADPFPSSRGGE